MLMGIMAKWTNFSLSSSRLPGKSPLRTRQVQHYAVQLLLDQVPDAEQTLATIENLGMESRSTYFMRLLLLMRFLKAISRLQRKPSKKRMGDRISFNMLDSVARIQEFEGRYAEAAATWKRAQTQAEKAGAHDVEATFLLTAMTGEALINRCNGINGKIKMRWRWTTVKPRYSRLPIRLRCAINNI